MAFEGAGCDAADLVAAGCFFAEAWVPRVAGRLGDAVTEVVFFVAVAFASVAMDYESKRVSSRGA